MRYPNEEPDSYATSQNACVPRPYLAAHACQFASWYRSSAVFSSSPKGVQQLYPIAQVALRPAELEPLRWADADRRGSGVLAAVQSLKQPVGLQVPEPRRVGRTEPVLLPKRLDRLLLVTDLPQAEGTNPGVELRHRLPGLAEHRLELILGRTRFGSLPRRLQLQPEVGPKPYLFQVRNEQLDKDLRRPGQGGAWARSPCPAPALAGR